MKKEIRYFALFVVLVCVYFHDVFFRDALLTVEDGFSYYYPMMITMAKQFKAFSFPFWNPLEYSGFPLFASQEPGALYPFNVVLPLLLDPSSAYNLNLMLHYALAGFFTFLYARQIGLPVFASLFSGTVFALLGSLPAQLNHPNIVAAAVWIPLLLFFCERLKHSLEIRDALYASLVVALQLYGGHPQICFYTYLLLVLFAVFALFDLEGNRRLRFISLLLLSLVLGWLLALPQIVASYELAMRGIRADTTYEYFASYSFPLHMIPSFLFPFFYYLGGSRAGEMWGTTPVIGMDAFIGILPFLLSLAVLTRWKKNRSLLFWGTVMVAAFVLALGDSLRPLNRLLYHLPIYDAFRGHSKLILLVSLSISILAGFGISFLQEREGEGRGFRLLMAVVLLVVIVTSLVAFTIFQGDLRSFFQQTFSHMRHFQMRWHRTTVPEKALSISDPSVYGPVIVMCLYLLCVLGLWRARKKTATMLLLSAIFLLLYAEALSWKIVTVPRKTDVENYNRDLYSLLSSYTKGRTVFLAAGIPPLTAMPYGVRLTDGYESLETEDYAKIFPRMYLQPPRTWRLLLEYNAPLSMTNTRYLVVSKTLTGVEKIHRHVLRDKNGRFVPANPRLPGAFFAPSLPIYRRIADFTYVTLYENLLALPRAYSVVRVKGVESVEKLRQQLFSFRMSPWLDAAVSSPDLREIGVQHFSRGEVTIAKEGPSSVTLLVKFTKKGFVVLTDHFYPGWRAYIDGRRTTIYRTNGIMRGVVVPAGEHTITFRYVPLHIYASMALSGILACVILVVLLRRSADKGGADVDTERQAEVDH